MSLRIVFAGTPPFSAHILQSLINTHHKLVGVYTQPDRKKGRGQQLTPSPVKILATELGIPIYQAARLKDPIEHEILKNLKPDVLVVVAYGLILPPAVLAIPIYGCINIHASNLPRWRGAAPIQRSILAGDTETGICIMQMDAGLDTGDVLNRITTPIYATDTSQTLHDRLADIGAAALIQTLEQLEQGLLKPEKQDNNLATYANKITKEEARVDWTQNVNTIDCQIRGFNPWPVAYTHLNNLDIRVFAAEPIPHAHTDLEPGTILESSANGIYVATGEGGILKLLELQLPGAKRLTVRDILNAKRELFQTGFSFQS
jgi:methionyl-tRNA formyltransferase